MQPIVKLGNVCKIQNGYAFDSKKFNESKGFPLIRIRNIKPNRTDTLFDGDYPKEFVVKNGDFLIGMDGEFNHTIWEGGEALLNQRVCRLYDFNLALKEYIYYIIGKKLKEIEGNTVAVTVKHISSKQILSIEIPLPPLETQKAIVAKLDQIFAELDQTKSEIQKNLDNTDELWKSALNQAFQGDWEMKKLEEICEVIAGQSPESDYYNENGEGLPFFQGKTEFTEKYIGEPKKWTTKTTKESLKNDILMSVRAPVGPVNINGFEKICIGRGLCAIRPGDNVKLDYVFDYLLSIQDKISGNRGSVFDSINRNQIESIELPVPSISEQEKIVEHLDQVSKEVKELKSQYQSQLDNLEELKKSVLDKAFKGEMGE